MNRPVSWTGLPEPLLIKLINEIEITCSDDISYETMAARIMDYACHPGEEDIGTYNEQKLEETYEKWTDDEFQEKIIKAIEGFQYQIDRLKKYL